MTVATLLKRHKAAQYRLRKAVQTYKRLARKVYILQGDGSFLPLAKLVLTELGCLDTGALMKLRRREVNPTLYRFGRDGKPHVKPYECKCGKRQPCTRCDFCDGQSCDGGEGEFICRDFQTILDCEAAIESNMRTCADLEAKIEAAVGVADACRLLFGN